MIRDESYVSSFTAEPEPGRSRIHGYDRPQYKFDQTGIPVEVIEAVSGGLFCLFLYDFDPRDCDWGV